MVMMAMFKCHMPNFKCQIRGRVPRSLGAAPVLGAGARARAQDIDTKVQTEDCQDARTEQAQREEAAVAR